MDDPSPIPDARAGPPEVARTGSAPHAAWSALERSLGVEVALDVFHGTLRRAAQGLHERAECGTMLVTCSDEFMGEVRGAFARDVARPLTAQQMIGSRGTYAVANLGGRFEPGAIALADEHFARRPGSHAPQTLLIELATHVGRRRKGHESAYGEIDRFGRVSACCGALARLLEAPPETAAVKHPWFDQLSAFFGPARLEALRGDHASMRLTKAAIVHAVLQAESAIADLMREPPLQPRDVLLVGIVAVNQPGVDGALPVAVHHLRFDGEWLHMESGAALRSTPAALEVEERGGRLAVRSLEEASRPSGAVSVARLHEVSAALPPLQEPRERAALQRRLQRVRQDVTRAKRHPGAWRARARPLLRGLVQGLSIVTPEVGLAVFALQAGADAVKAEHVRKLLREGPRREEARETLRHVEAQLQQLSHAEAQDILDVLVAEHSPLWKL